MSIFKDKHLIVGYSDHIFTNLYIDALVNKAYISKDKMIFVTLDNKNEFLIDLDVKKIVYDKSLISSMLEASSYTLMSFTPANSFFANDLFEIAPQNLEKVIIYITDDELDRWYRIKEKTGKLQAYKKLSISEVEIKLLPYLNNFILIKSLASKLESILNRKNLNIIDVQPIFGTLPIRLQNKFNLFLDANDYFTKQENKILIGSKREAFKLKDILKLFKALDRKKIITDYKYLLFTYEKQKSMRMIIDLYCLYQRHIKKNIIDISYMTNTNSFTYTSLVMSCSHFILQARGGASTAMQFIENQRGVLFVPKDSQNDLMISKGLGVDTAAFKNYEDLVTQLKNNIIDINKNSIIFKKNIDLAIEKLVELYR